MESIITGVSVGVILVLVNLAICAWRDKKKKAQHESEQTQDNTQRIDTLETQAAETKELVKTTLGMCIIIGDGMIQSGVNGDVKKAFSAKKQDALKML